MRRSGLLLLALITLAAGAPAQTRDTKTLDIYVADTEGGKAALFVSPAGQTVLVDSASPVRETPIASPPC